MFESSYITLNSCFVPPFMNSSLVLVLVTIGLVLMLLFHIIVFFLSPIVLTARISFHKVVEFVFIGYSVLFERRSHRASSQSRQHDAAR